MSNLNFFIIWMLAILSSWPSPNSQQAMKDFPKAFHSLSTQPEKRGFTNKLYLDNSGGHLQGVQLYSEKGQTFAYISGSSSTHSYMVKVDINPPAKVIAIDTLMSSPYRHAGGFQIYQNFLAVGIEDNHTRTSSKVLIYDIAGGRNDWTSPLYTIKREGAFERFTAGAVAITRYQDEIVVAVANWDSRNIDFYTCPSHAFENNEGEFNLIASVIASDFIKENWSDPYWWSYQNINLLTDATDNLYLVCFGQNNKDMNLADVFKVSFAEVDYKGKDFIKPNSSIQLQKIHSRIFDSTEGANFRAGAGFHIQGDGSLVLVSCPNQIEPKNFLNLYFD
jgi:hypothetical protein